MIPLLSLAAFAALTGSTVAAPADTTTTTHHERQCTTFDLQIPVTAENVLFDIPHVDNSIDAVDFVWDLQRWTAPNITDRIIGPVTVEDTFTINAQLCVPKHAPGNILHIATHGFGFEKTYWDSPLNPPKYSYVDAALASGYSVLTYDRLGVGKSSKPNAYTIVQAGVQVEILKEITLRAREGTLFTSPSTADAKTQKHNLPLPSFTKIVLVGHSLGSGITIGALSKYGDANIIDAAVSTGLIVGGKFGGTGQDAFGLEFAAQNDQHKFHDRGSGYLVQGSKSAVNQIFFKKGYFEEELLEFGFQGRETGTVGEFLSLGVVLANPAPEFKGPILFALGEYDFATCAGNCTDSWDQEVLDNVFSGASNVSVHVQPGSGHALTFHEDARGHYQAIFDYLGEHGL
ncbi:Alpha/Beta hydrolase protein [Aspergillus karnatakaensis]|uniref:alpha/beta hydrolase n=1 Tax=Aspergillus karnatakaensis TaxID=1810916 RepID=UPI003CCDFE1F